MADTRLPAISHLISRRSSHSYSIFLALRYDAIQCQAVWRKRTVADCWKRGLNDEPSRGNSLRFHVQPSYPERLWQKLSLETRWSPIARMKNHTSPESAYFYYTSCCCKSHSCCTSCSSRREFHVPSKRSISLTLRPKFRAAM